VKCEILRLRDRAVYRFGGHGDRERGRKVSLVVTEGVELQRAALAAEGVYDPNGKPMER
jgi:hypothetical protein